MDGKAEAVTSEELAARVEEFIRAAQARVLGSGREQYESDGTQRFESMTAGELIAWAREEAQDLAVYATMADLRLQEMESRLRDLE